MEGRGKADRLKAGGTVGDELRFFRVFGANLHRELGDAPDEAVSSGRLAEAKGAISAGLTTRRYARLVQEWWPTSDSILRSRQALAAQNEGGADLPTNRESSRGSAYACYSKIESTVRHMGIEVDDAIEIAEDIDI